MLGSIKEAGLINNPISAVDIALFDQIRYQIFTTKILRNLKSERFRLRLTSSQLPSLAGLSWLVMVKLYFQAD